MGDSSLSPSPSEFCPLQILHHSILSPVGIRFENGRYSKDKKKKKTIVVLQSDILNGKLDLKELENSDKNSKYTNKEEKKEAHEDV